MTIPTNGTLLVLTPASGSAFILTPYAARGLTQTLDPIGEGKKLIRRTVNGGLRNLTPTWMQKYKSTITCRDTETPCLNKGWLGTQVTVDCVEELSYKTGVDTADRTAVPGSTRTAGDFSYYRPRLSMRVVGIRNGKDEYNAAYAWQIDLEEI